MRATAWTFGRTPSHLLGIAPDSCCRRIASPVGSRSGNRVVDLRRDARGTPLISGPKVHSLSVVGEIAGGLDHLMTSRSLVQIQPPTTNIRSGSVCTRATPVMTANRFCYRLLPNHPEPRRSTPYDVNPKCRDLPALHRHGLWWISSGDHS